MSLRQELRLLACAVQMLTRLPTPHVAGFQPDWTTRAARYYPVAGQLVGLISAGVLLLASPVLGPAVAAILAVAAGALATGGFHEDGLADSFDGLGGGGTPKARLAIMKDSRIGTYGALALGLVTAVRIAALARMAPAEGALALLLAHGAARSAAVVVMAALPYAGDRASAKLAPAALPVSRGEAGVALLLGLWPALLMAWPAALTGLALAVAAAWLMAVQARRLIGGYTGDVLGAAEQLAEAGLLLGAAAAWPHA